MIPDNNKSVRKICECKDYKTFANEMDYLINFLRNFSDLIFLNGHIITFIASDRIFILNTSLIESSIQTLQSIKLCCSIGSFSDANTLIRKLRDDLILYSYILNIKLRKPFVEDDLKELKNDTLGNFTNSFLNIRPYNNLSDDVKAVEAWFNNKVNDLPVKIKKKLEFGNYMNALKQNENIVQILYDYKLKDYWETLGKNLNNYVHNNGSQFSTQNFIKANDKFLKTHLKNINFRVTYISSFFVIALLMIDSSLISATDNIDYLDCELEPPNGCQYLVAPFMQEFINKKVAKLHPKLKQYLIDNNICGMKIE
jgi:hypothetical protein